MMGEKNHTKWNADNPTFVCNWRPQPLIQESGNTYIASDLIYHLENLRFKEKAY
jgi:hypothetical protein